MAAEAAQPAPEKDKKITKESISVAIVWIFFGGTFLAVTGRLLLEIASGR